MSLDDYLKSAFDLILPRRCVVCGRNLNRHEEFVCLYCMADFPYTYHWTQKYNPMADRFNAVIQKGLEKAWEDDAEGTVDHENYACAAALFFFSDDAGYRHIPYQLKYQGNVRAGRYFGRMLGEKLALAQWASDIDMVIPVPLHWRRRWSRGYNQAEIIADQVGAVLGVPVRTDVLKRKRHTKTQTKLSVAGKAANVAGAFVAEGRFGSGPRHILLVDDVFTTGATLHSCFAALRQILPPAVRISVATLGFVG